MAVQENKNTFQALYEQQLKEFDGDNEKLIEHHTGFIERYNSYKEERSVINELKARRLTLVLKIATNEHYRKESH
jgi:hypothetical protein